jgi:hypothetical protein
MTTWTPMRWPDNWKDAALLDLLKGTAIDCLLIAKGDELAAVRARAQQAGIRWPTRTPLPPGSAS